MFVGVLDEIVQFVYACDEDIEILKTSHTLVVSCITMVGRAKKSHGGLAWPMALWIRSTRVFGVVDTKDLDLQVAGDPCLTLWL